MELEHDVFVYHLFPRCVIPIESHIKVIETYNKFKINISTFSPDIVIFHSIYKPQYFKYNEVIVEKSYSQWGKALNPVHYYRALIKCKSKNIFKVSIILNQIIK